jgi:hypothetical protein
METNQWTPAHGRGQLFEDNGSKVMDVKEAQQKHKRQAMLEPRQRCAIVAPFRVPAKDSNRIGDYRAIEKRRFAPFRSQSYHPGLGTQPGNQPKIFTELRNRPVNGAQTGAIHDTDSRAINSRMELIERRFSGSMPRSLKSTR